MWSGGHPRDRASWGILSGFVCPFRPTNKLLRVLGDDVHDHLMFYGVPLIPWQPYTLPPGMGLSLLKSERVS